MAVGKHIHQQGTRRGAQTLGFAHVGITLSAAQGVALARQGKALELKDAFVISIGSMLPDILDKPLGHIFLPEVFGCGRSFAHTLLFFVLLVAAALLSKRRELVLLAAASSAHLALDGMWEMPQVLFWPFYGTTFPPAKVVGFIPWVIEMAKTAREPEVCIPEAVGLVLLAANILAYLPSSGAATARILRRRET